MHSEVSMTKRCTKCKQTKAKDKFRTDNSRKDGSKNECKECSYTRQKDYRRTKQGILKQTYCAMANRVSGKHEKARSAVGKPIVIQDVFEQWAMKDQEFHLLYDKWKSSGFEYGLRPTVDRIDNDKGYILGNMQWLSFRDNCKKH